MGNGISHMCLKQARTLKYDPRQDSPREAMSALHCEGVAATKVYDIIKLIGRGTLGEVYSVSKKPKHQQQGQEKAALQVAPKRVYACKAMSTLKMRPDQFEDLMNEVSIMRQLDHPNIVDLFEVYTTPKKTWLIMELCRGGDLYSRELDEAGTAVVMEQILQALCYLHERGICHRDIKLESEYPVLTDMPLICKACL